MTSLMAVVSTKKIEFIGAALPFDNIVLDRPGPTGGIVILVIGFINGEPEQYRSFQQDKRVMPPVAGVYLAVHRGVGEGTGQQGLVPIRYNGHYRPMYRGRVAVYKEDEIGQAVIVQVVDLHGGYPAPEGIGHRLVGRAFVTDGSDR